MSLLCLLYRIERTAELLECDEGIARVAAVFLHRLRRPRNDLGGGTGGNLTVPLNLPQGFT
jgi:hypothetical protein